MWSLCAISVVLFQCLVGCCSGEASPTVVIDGYTHNTTLTSGDSVPLGTQIILFCHAVGLRYGTLLNYTWICPSGPCEVEGYYGRKVYSKHILAVNTTSTSDGGTYTCQVTATGGQEATGSFTLTVTGGDVVHSYGRLIPHDLPITDLQQISGPDGIGRITCTDSSRTASFAANGGQLETGGVSQTRNGATATLEVNPSNPDSFQNRALYCTDINTNFFYLLISSDSPLSVPSLTVNSVTNAAVEYRVRRNDSTTDAVITGNEVIRFGVPMIGQYVNTGRGSRVTISPAVPGAQYRITAWALHGDSGRSATPTVVDVTTGEANPSPPRNVTITGVFQDSVELNWLPPTEPNGVVHFSVVVESRAGQQIRKSCGPRHCNATALQEGVTYSIMVVATTAPPGAPTSSAPLTHKHMHTTAAGHLTTPPFIEIIISVPLAVLIVLICICCAITLTAAVWWCRKRREESGDYDLVLAHGNTTRTCQPSTVSPYSGISTFGSEGDTLNGTAQGHPPQVQPYAILNLPNGGDGGLQAEGMYGVGEVDQVGVDTVGGADRGDGNNREYKELDLKTLEVHPYTPLDVSTLTKEEEEGNVKKLAEYFGRKSSQAK